MSRIETRQGWAVVHIDSGLWLCRGETPKGRKTDAWTPDEDGAELMPTEDRAKLAIARLQLDPTQYEPRFLTVDVQAQKPLPPSTRHSRKKYAR